MPDVPVSRPFDAGPILANPLQRFIAGPRGVALFVVGDLAVGAETGLRRVAPEEAVAAGRTRVLDGVDEQAFLRL